MLIFHYHSVLLNKQAPLNEVLQKYFVKQVVHPKKQKDFLLQVRYPFFHPLFENTREMKNGAPSNEVIVPTGISAGALTTRATVSASNIRIAPPTIERGISERPFAPKILRIIGGAIKPTKPIVPPAQTAAEEAREPAIITSKRSLPTSTPKESAVVSPPAKRSSCLPEKRSSTIARNDGIRINNNSSHPRPLKLPSIHIYMVCSSLDLINRMIELNAE